MTEEEKQTITKEAYSIIHNLGKLHNIDVESLPKEIQDLLRSCFLEGITFPLKMRKSQEQKEEEEITW